MATAAQSPAAALANLRANVGVPQRLDIPVIAERDIEWTSRSRIALQLTAEDGHPLGRAYVFNGEWYPGCTQSTAFSHYFPALARTFDGLEQAERPNRLRLQLLKAVAAETSKGGTIIVLLKFILAPEWTLSGGQLETVYGCPIASFYGGFVGVDRDPLRDATSPTFTVGNAIHAGYRHAAAARTAGADDETAARAYHDAVARTWADDFAHLLLDRPSGRPKALHRRPLAAREMIMERLTAFDGHDEAERALLQERLFFAPGRGISGRADRLVYRHGGDDADGAVESLHEIKTGGGFGAEKDPLTGIPRPGGLQALAYREIVRALGAGDPETYVEAIEDDLAHELPLEDHPIVRRARARIADGGNDRALDLLAQSRNIGFLATSGLLTGYDRYRIDTIAGIGRRIRGLGGDWSLQASSTPCQICVASARNICESARTTRAPIANFFRHLPQELYIYWVWLHRQLQDEERTGREALYHLTATPLATLEGQEGISIGNLAPRGHIPPGAGLLTLARDERIETRLREDDRILVTPADRAPGELLSVEGTLRAVGAHEVTVELRDSLPPSTSRRYRLDQLPFRSPWQIQGLTDFLIGAIRGALASGRQLRVAELPHLARLILGAAEPTPLTTDDASLTTPDLNADQRRALIAALNLAPGDLLLLQGPPGTGKTSTIATLAHAIARRDFFADPDDTTRRPLLILANTHRAADEVTRKIASAYPDLRPYLIRVGTARAATEPEVRAHILPERLKVRETLESLDLDDPAGLEAWVRLIRAGVLIHDHAQIFVGTLAAANAPELRGLAFSTVIVDETGQATEPAALQSLRHLPHGYAGRLILVGDHQQLPPVVPDIPDATPLPPLPATLAAAGFPDGRGLKISLFERLANRYPSALITLAAQYRMNAPISALVSDLFYDGALHPGTPTVAAARLSNYLSLPDCPTARLPDSPWNDTPILFLDTSRDPAARDTVRQWSADESRDNPREATLIADLIISLFRQAPRDRWPELATEVGVISAYRKQNNRLRAELTARDQSIASLPGLRIDTVDRFQGGERQIILVSLVNSNDGNTIGALHADPRRLNVAISRARTKLILVGDRATFTGPGKPEEAAAKELYRRLFALLDAQVQANTARIIGTESL
ncbi:MAG: DEAD/DEAH box helicase family protein [Chloroflexia bacterium]